MARQASQYIIKVIAASVAAILFVACHSSKPTQKPPSASYQPKVIEYRADAVGIDAGMAQRIEEEARRWVGTRYTYGGTTRIGTDCSGMVMTIYQDVAGIKLPRNSAMQHQACSPLGSGEMASGDLVFFTTSKDRGRINHVGIYIGKGNFVHASTSRGVIVSGLNEPYYQRHFHSARRVPGIASANTHKQAKDKPADKKPSKAAAPRKLRTISRIKPQLKAVRQAPALPQLLTAPYVAPFIPFDSEPADDTETDTIRDEVRKAMIF